MGDNQTRSRTVAGGAIVDQWTTTPGAATFELTVAAHEAFGCPVAIDTANQKADGSVEVATVVVVAPEDTLPSGPHRFIVAGELGGSAVLRAVPLSDSDAGSCTVAYTFKWAG